MTNSPSTTDPGLVSVVMPTYNGAAYICESVESVLAQTYPAVELIVVDDGSTDGTAELLASFGQKISVCRISNSGGPSRPRNAGVALARGHFIAFCDGDDIMAPTAIAEAVKTFQEIPEVSVTWADCETISKDGAVEKPSVLLEYQDFRENLQATHLTGTSLLDGQKIFSCLLRGLFLGISAVVVRKNVFDEVGPFDETLKNSDDREMWLRIARLGHTFAFQDKILFSYRQHTHSVSNRGYLRMPGVIKNLSSQLQYLPQGDDRDFVLDKIMQYHLSLGWGLRSAGDFIAAEKSYRRALSRRISWQGLRGVILSRLGQISTWGSTSGKSAQQ